MSLLALAAVLLSTTLPVQAPSPVSPRVVALVIGNNAGGEALPTLSYADDDAVRMTALLQQTGATVELLTRLDTDTARATDIVPTGPPTRAAVVAATARLASIVSSSSSSPSVFMLYFAGHGDAEQGTGALLLEDGPLHHDDLRTAIDAVKATTTHVVLDACNAFFVVHARGAGGRAWTTPSTAGAALSSSVSDVGVFVSTSAEAQVFEWSQLQGGIFSHALRSGLRGAADVDVDGVVTYAELEGFIRVATDGIVNAAYVPQLFARAPQRTTTLLDVRAVARQPLPSDGAGRLTVRDERGAVVVDMHPEPGFTPLVLLPAGPLLLERLDARGQWTEHLLDDATTTTSTTTTAQARGPAGLLQRLFAEPFGPTTLRAFVTRPRPAEVYGLSIAQEQRLRLYLQTLSDDASRARAAARWGSTTFAAATALGFGGAAAVFAAQGESSGAIAAGAVGVLFAGMSGVLATGVVNGPGEGELAAEALLREPPRATDPPGVRAAHVANTIDAIDDAAERAAGGQQALVVTGFVTAGVALGLGAIAVGCPSCVDNNAPEQARTIGSFMLVAGALSASVSTMAAVLPSDAGRLEALMRHDPESVAHEPR